MDIRILLTALATVLMVVLCQATSDADQAIQIVGKYSCPQFSLTDIIQLPANTLTFPASRVISVFAVSEQVKEFHQTCQNQFR